MTHENPEIISRRDLVDYEIQKMLTAELLLQNHILAWSRAAASPQLKETLNSYLGLVRQHIDMMGSFLDKEYIILRSFPNLVMRALVTETDLKLSYCRSAATRDAGLLVNILSVNDYKFSSYNTTAYLADMAGMKNQADIFRKIAENEKEINERFLRLREYATIY